MLSVIINIQTHVSSFCYTAEVTAFSLYVCIKLWKLQLCGPFILWLLASHYTLSLFFIWDFAGAIQPFSKKRIKCCEALYEVGVKKSSVW